MQVGESVVVFGVGGVGLNVVQFAALAGAYPIVAVDLVDGKLDMARARGATHSLNPTTAGDLEAAIRAIVGAKGPDKMIETTGVKSVIELAYDGHPPGRHLRAGRRSIGEGRRSTRCRSTSTRC